MSSVSSITHKKLRLTHRWTAVLLCVFIIMHLTNHLVALAGVEAHIAYMEFLRGAYRLALVEGVLLAAIVLQVGLGIYLFIKAMKYPPSFFGRLQLISGAYLGFFLANHVGAVLYGRIGSGLDTNFYYAVAGYQFSITWWFFAPYYFLAVIAFFTHIACALYWVRYGVDISSARQRAVLLISLGVIVSVLVSSALLGISIQYDVPAEYLVMYGG